VQRKEQDLLPLAAKDPALLCSSVFMGMVGQGQTWCSTSWEEPYHIAEGLFSISTASAKEWGWQKAVSEVLGSYSFPHVTLGVCLNVRNPQHFCCAGRK